MGIEETSKAEVSQSEYAETVHVSRRLVRFDGKPAAGAKVRVLTDHANPVRHPEVEAIADGDGVFSVDLNQEGSAWGDTSLLGPKAAQLRVKLP